MESLYINIDWSGKNYCAAPLDERIACVATGQTIEEIKQRIVDGLEFHFEGMERNGQQIPEEYRSGWSPVFVLSARAMIKYSDKFLNRRALADVTGINQHQLSHYANGLKTPRPATRQRISDGLRTIVAQLSFLL